MAENEKLDRYLPHRWNAVCAALESGQPLEEITRMARRALCGAVRKTFFQDFPHHGVSLEEILDAAAKGPDAVHLLVQQCQGHDFARLFERVETTANRQDMLRTVFDAIWEKVRDHLAVRVRNGSFGRNVEDLCCTLDSVRERLNPDIQYMAQRLAEDPTRKPRLRRSRQNHRPAGDGEAILSFSMLGKQEGGS